jgi:hypothetical protein
MEEFGLHIRKAEHIVREQLRMNLKLIRITETTYLLLKTHNWKSLRSDKIADFWLKAFPFSRSYNYVTKIFNRKLEEHK